jgi:hypothetical protein
MSIHENKTEIKISCYCPFKIYRVNMRETEKLEVQRKKKLKRNEAKFFPYFFASYWSEKFEAKTCENMRNFHFIFSRKKAKTKRNGLRFASRCEITKKNKKRNGRTLLWSKSTYTSTTNSFEFSFIFWMWVKAAFRVPKMSCSICIVRAVMF